MCTRRVSTILRERHLDCLRYYWSYFFHFFSKVFCTSRVVLSVFICVAGIQSVKAVPINLHEDVAISLVNQQHLYIAKTDNPPESISEIESWLRQQEPAEKINLFGGSYWLYAEIVNQSAITEWVINPNGTLIERVNIYVYNEDNTPPDILLTGYRAKGDYTLHYGKDLQLEKNTRHKVLIRFESAYFASLPKFDVVQKTVFQQEMLFENVLTLAAFGALLTLALYNFFIYLIAREVMYFHYAAYLFVYFVGWAFTFHLPAEMFRLKVLSLHYIPFFLLPVLNTLFYLNFLQLNKYSPRLASLSRINIILPLILLPSCFIALPYAHMLATVVITIWLLIALASGITCLRQGFRPARYFVLAFIALLIPGALILPANVGLIPDLLKNSELVTLLGGTLDAILLAFALADKINLLSAENKSVVKRLHESLKMATTDNLTKINNRYAFDQDIKQLADLDASSDRFKQVALFMIDLDGLKSINDYYGHVKGDELLCYFSKGLFSLESEDTRNYRIGGDEFTILTTKANIQNLRNAMGLLEENMRNNGFKEAGISYGVASASECDSLGDMVVLADKRMYVFKAARRHSRLEDKSVSLHNVKN